jgi:general secretion pathway protein C
LAIAVTSPHGVGIAGKCLAALLVLALLWLIGTNVWRMVLQRAIVIGTQLPLPTAQNAAQTVIAANLFGSAATAPTETIQANSNIDVQLKGVYAPQGAFSGFAIVSVDSRRDAGIIAGGEIKSGITLHAVHADHILIARDGLIERVDLTSTAIATPIAGKRASSQSLSARPLAANIYAVSRGEFRALISDTRQLAMLAQLGNDPGGGVLINEAADSTLVSKLGLKQGDIIRKINGQIVGGKEDLMKIAIMSPTANEVSVEGARNGRPLQLTYNVLP